ncbi:hypothetical protein SAMN05216410_1052 [Sanguibacter gelidistatuariae]|uniref:Glyoxalase-like domain-containing protein n=1 Tax=Sanguibacter gelidistatuariae TaxID=1814289 RepID=A0A1G6HHP0_9MICO|nr:VOC family protein [Sanguibacter gelidistatuariae]SDB93760.1 hypothetical protein SAMN05216410_1052 [Sanguibacter gelidistatuariae]
MTSRVRLQEIVVDCADVTQLAVFWGALLDARWAVLDDGWAVVEADPLLLAFQRVPEPKSSPKNRLHLDILVPDAAAAIAQALALGGSQVGEPVLTDGDGYVVMRDLEDNEFCFVIDNHGRWGAQLESALAAGQGHTRQA